MRGKRYALPHRSGYFAIGCNSPRFHNNGLCRVTVVSQFGLHGKCCRRNDPAFWLGHRGLHAHAPRRDMNGACDVEPHVPVNAAALVPPAFALPGVRAHDEDIFAAEVRRFGNIKIDGRVAAFPFPNRFPVQKHAGIAVHAVEIKPNRFAFIPGGQNERFTIPADAEFFCAVPDVAVIHKRVLDHEIVRHVQFAPRRIVEICQRKRRRGHVPDL